MPLIVKPDCSFFEGSKPCKYHKIDGRLCEDCNDYKKIELKILIIKLDAMGDVLRTTSILPALLKKYLNSQITWITKSNSIDLLKNNEFINRIFAIEESYLPIVLNEEFDISISLDADLQSASILSLSKAVDKFGFIADEKGEIKPANENAKEWYDLGLNDSLKRNNRKTYQQHIYAICGLKDKIYKPQFNVSILAEEFGNSFKENNNLSSFNKIIGINTGGGNRWQFKKWILEYYVELIDLIHKSENEVEIILYGGPEEVDFNKEILNNVKRKPIDAGCTNSVSEFASLIELSDVFLTPDSLGMHLSIALNKTTLVIVGPTSPWELDVFGNGEIIYNKDLDCIACYKSKCDFKINCMNSLSPEYIFKKLDRFL